MGDSTQELRCVAARVAAFVPWFEVLPDLKKEYQARRYLMTLVDALGSSCAESGPQFPSGTPMSLPTSPSPEASTPSLDTAFNTTTALTVHTLCPGQQTFSLDGGLSPYRGLWAALTWTPGMAWRETAPRPYLHINTVGRYSRDPTGLALTMFAEVGTELALPAVRTTLRVGVLSYTRLARATAAPETGVDWFTELSGYISLSFPQYHLSVGTTLSTDATDDTPSLSDPYWQILNVWAIF